MKKKLNFKLISFSLCVSLFAMAFLPSLKTNATSLTNISSQEEYVVDTSNLNVIGLENIKLNEGEIIKIPLEFDSEYKSVSGNTREIFEGNAGYLELTPSGNSVSYKVVVNIPTTHFIGTMSITNLTSGLGSGYNPLYSFSGSVSYNRYTGHNYSASVDGAAYFGTLKVAYTAPNYISWRG